MAYSAILSVVPIPTDDGNTTYTVTAELQKPNKTPLTVTGKLPSAKPIFTIYDEWRDLYKALLKTLNPLVFTQITTPHTHVSRDEFEKKCTLLGKSINNWFADDEFNPINDQMRGYFDRIDPILLTIKTDDQNLYCLPFHLWNFFEYFRNTELILSNLNNI
jgi:hypothetical protein